MSSQPATSITVTPADYLDIPEDRRRAARDHVAAVSKTVRKVALELPLGADVDDFRRNLTAEAK